MTMTFEDLLSYIPEVAYDVPSALLVLALGVLGGRLLGVVLSRAVRRFASPGWELITRRLPMWGGIALGSASALQTLGLDLSVLLGAAGFVTVALGFAAQTSTSNFISGLFLMLEAAVKVGDLIEVGTVSGEVVSIDPLSVRLRTFDNRMVRIPNETLVKANLTNLTSFPIRRIDFTLLVPQEANLAAVRASLRRLAENEPHVLQEPAPLIQVQAFEGGNARFLASYWASQDVWVEVRTDLATKIPLAVQAAGSQLGMPRLDLPTHAERP